MKRIKQMKKMTSPPDPLSTSVEKGIKGSGKAKWRKRS
jgi:hypothetical protein